MPNPAQEVLKARLGAKTIELWIDLNPKSQPPAAVVIGSLKPEQRVLFISQSRIDRRDIVWRHIPPLRSFLQRIQDFLRVSLATRGGISVSKGRGDLWVIKQTVGLAQFVNRGGKPALLFVSPAQYHVRPV